MLKRLLLLLLLLIGFSIMLTACNEDLSLDQKDLELAVGESITLKAQGAEPDELEWTSSDTSVATVDQLGKVRAVGPGTAMITVKAGDKTAASNIEVTLELSLTSDSLWIGVRGTSNNAVHPIPSGETVVWTSEDPGIAKVDLSGNITGLTQGTTKVTARVGDSTAVCDVIVFAIDPGQLVLVREETYPLQVTRTPEGETVTWKVTDEEIAEIDPSGIVTAVSPGSTVVTANIAGGVTRCEIAVLGTSPDRIVLKPGDSRKVQVMPLPEGKSVAWRSEDPEIARVDESGNVTAVASGSTTIIASLDNKEVESSVFVSADVSSGKIATVTGVITPWHSFSPDGSLLISHTPPFGGGNVNSAAMLDLKGKEYSLPSEPCTDMCWFGDVSWRDTRFVYSVVDDDYRDTAVIYVYDTSDHSRTNITQDFQWSRYDNLHYGLEPVFYSEDNIGLMLPDGLWNYDLEGEVWTQTHKFQREIGPYHSFSTYWSPDFSKAAWLEEADGSTQLLILSISSGDIQTVEGLHFSSGMLKLAWSGDGAKLAWLDNGEVEDKLVILDIESGHHKTVLAQETIADFAWSEDSTRLVAAGVQRGIEETIYFPLTILSSEGSVIKYLTDPGNYWDGVRVGTALTWVPGQDKIAYSTADGLVIRNLSDGERWLVLPPSPSKEMMAHEMYEYEKERGFPMFYTWTPNGDLAISIHFGGRISYGVMEIYRLDWDAFS